MQNSSALEYDLETANIDDLLTLVGSALSGVAIVFAMVLYGHYRHLHSLANHHFVFGILFINLVSSANYFFCIFSASRTNDSQDYFSPTRCKVCGFVEQVHSFVEPFLSTMFWLQIFSAIHKVDIPMFRGKWELGVLLCSTWGFGITSALVALLNDWFTQDMQAWCWIGGADLIWFRIFFCWLWVGTTLACMVLALAQPLCSDMLNDTQRMLLVRRGLLGLSWVGVNTISILTRYFGTRGWSVVQALCEPSLGIINVLAFLYSERMMTLRALGLPPGAEPPYGFTAAMRYIPEKIHDEATILLSR